jgi:hypothetical protein
MASYNGVPPRGAKVSDVSRGTSEIGLASARTSWGSWESNCTSVINASAPSACWSARKALKPPTTSEAIDSIEPERSRTK